MQEDRAESSDHFFSVLPHLQYSWPQGLGLLWLDTCSLCLYSKKTNPKVCMFYSFPQAQAKILCTSLHFQQAASFAELSCIISSLQGLKPSNQLQENGGGKLTVTHKTMLFSFFALEMQLKCNLKQQGSTPSTPPEAHLLQPAPLHLHRQMIAKSIRRDIKPPAPGLSQPLTSRVRKKFPSGRLFPNSGAGFFIFCTFPWKLGRAAGVNDRTANSMDFGGLTQAALTPARSLS